MTRAIDAGLVLDSRAELGEGVIWDAGSQRLVWVDITRGLIHEMSADGRCRSSDAGQHVGAVAPRGHGGHGGLVLAVRSGFAALDGDGTISMIAHVEADAGGNRMNDGGCDPQGRFWAGTMAYAETPGAGSLYRLDQDGTVHRMLTGTAVSNGLGWSPDGRTMYYIDTPTHGVDAFAFDPRTGAIAGRRRLVTVDPADGSPDGMTVDDEGFLWVALWGGGAVRRYQPDGTLDTVVRVAASKVTSCAFGGADRGDLYITTASTGLSPERLAAEPHAGGLFRCRPGVTGPPATPFTG